MDREPESSRWPINGIRKAGWEEGVKKTPSVVKEARQSDQGFLAPAELQFDLENPRFIDQHFQNELEIIQYLYDRVGVDELIQSILSAGYVDFEPLIVQRGTNVVLEGNRRLAALRLIQNENTRKQLKIVLPDI